MLSSLTSLMLAISHGYVKEMSNSSSKCSCFSQMVQTILQVSKLNYGYHSLFDSDLLCFLVEMNQDAQKAIEGFL